MELACEGERNSRGTMMLASILFAVLWVGGMIWWTGPEGANIVILSICGAIAGVAWYFLMRKCAGCRRPGN